MFFVGISRWLVAFAGLVLVASPVTAAAQGDDAGEIDLVAADIHWEVLEHIVEELAYLVVLGEVSEPLPVLVQELPARLGIGEAPSDVYEAQLTNLERNEGPALLERAAGHDLSMSAATAAVLRPSNGIRLDVDDYLAAYDDAMWQWWEVIGRDYGAQAAPLGTDRLPDWHTGDGPPPVLEPVEVDADALDAADPSTDSVADSDDVVAPVPESSPTPETPAVAEESIDRPAEADGDEVRTAAPGPVTTAADGDGTGSSVPVLGLFGGAVAIAFVVAAAVIMIRSRRRPRVADAGTGRTDDLLEAGRRFVAATSVDVLGSQVASSAHRLSCAGGVVFVTDDGSWASGSQPAVADHLVEQVRATGRTVRIDDLALVAVLSRGQVLGVIAAGGSAVAVDVVEQLAPLAGEGLANLLSRDAAEQLAYVDALTGVPNRRRFDRDLSDQSRRAAGEGLPVAVAMIDVDHFKTYNDTNGHQDGDEALRAVARLIEQSLRAEDTVYRYGGEEFAVLLPGADVEAAHGVAERIRRAVEGHAFSGGPTQPGGRVTVSIGVSTSPPPDGDLIVEAADAALYRAKDRGRNQVVFSDAAD